ncbi:hypothetical protein Tco_0669969 [Tanacetum coccineum]
MFTYNREKYFVLRAGRRGKVQKVGEFTMAFEESPNMSKIVRVPDLDNPKKYMQKSVISRLWFSIPLYLNCHLTCSMHLIQGDGTFNIGGFDSFIKRVIMAECALFDGVFAIMGPQNSVSYQYAACDGSFFPSQMKLSGAVVQGQCLIFTHKLEGHWHGRLCLQRCSRLLIFEYSDFTRKSHIGEDAMAKANCLLYYV